MMTEKKEMDRNIEIVVEEIEKELRGFNLKEPVIDLRSGVPLWEETILDKALRNANLGDAVDEVAEAVEALRRENQVCLLSFTLQALHEDGVGFFAWTLPSGITAYLMESWNGEAQLFGIDTKSFSDERAAHLVSTLIRSIYMEDGVIQVSPYDVKTNLRNRSEEIDLLLASGAA